MTTTLEQINDLYVRNVPHMREIGVRVEALERGRATMLLPARADWLGDPRRGVLHPGALTVLADSACGLAVMSAMRVRTPIATLDLRMDYLRATEAAADVRCEAHCDRVSRNVAFVRANLWQSDRESPIARAQGTFMVIRLPDRKSPSEEKRPDDARWHAPSALDPLPPEHDVPYVRFLGVKRSSTGEGTIYRLPFQPKIVGNPLLPALHGGVIAGFAETAAALHLLETVSRPRFPKGIDFSIDYLRTGRAEETYAVCETVRVGSRVALVQVRCWQRAPEHPIAVARSHVLLAEREPLEREAARG